MRKQTSVSAHVALGSVEHRGPVTVWEREPLTELCEQDLLLTCRVRGPHCLKSTVANDLPDLHNMLMSCFWPKPLISLVFHLPPGSRRVNVKAWPPHTVGGLQDVLPGPE